MIIMCSKNFETHVNVECGYKEVSTFIVECRESTVGLMEGGGGVKPMKRR